MLLVDLDGRALQEGMARRLLLLPKCPGFHEAKGSMRHPEWRFWQRASWHDSGILAIAV